MATTVAERKLFVAGEWVETGDWIDVTSPYSGEVVGRVAKAGADETRRAIDAAEQALQEPLPAHKRAEILVKVVAGIARRHEEVARQISDEAGKPLVELAPLRRLPAVDEVGDVVRHVHEIEVAVPDDLVGDGDAAAARVTDVEPHAAEYS